MKYIGLFDEKEDIVTKEKLEAVEDTIPTKTSQLDNDSGFITSAPVTSVNTKTGAVTLSASDVSAIPSTLTGTAGQVLTKTADGQEWKDAAKELPAVTDSDNGKFLRVVSGAWEAASSASQYVQPDEPIDAPEFSLWVDTDEEALYIARAEGVGF